MVSNIVYFHLDPWGRFPFWRAYFVNWVEFHWNHQAENVTKIGIKKLGGSTTNWATKKKTWLVGLYRGWNTTHLRRDYFINHEIRIPSLTNQDFPWKVRARGFFDAGSTSGFSTLRLFWPLADGGVFGVDDVGLRRKKLRGLEGKAWDFLLGNSRHQMPPKEPMEFKISQNKLHTGIN